MKRFTYLVTALLMIFVAGNVLAQGDKSKRPSPPKTANASVGDLEITINYGAPSVKGRTIFGGLEPYGKVWRTGANEATTFTVNKNVEVNGESLPAGKYALFTIPTEDKWTVIFSKNPDQWGAYSYNQDEDALRIEVEPEKTDEVQEQLNFTINDEGMVKFSWEYQSFEFEVEADD